MKKILFIDRDGTLVEEPNDEILDSFEKLIFLPEVFTWLRKICDLKEFDLVMVTNQDGLGTDALPNDKFYPVQNFIIETLKSEKIEFSEILIDDSFPHEKKNTRKPGTGMLTKYFSDEYNLNESYVIGDRYTDIELAKNLGAKGILLNNKRNLGTGETENSESELENEIALKTNSWQNIYDFLTMETRHIIWKRNTKETKIYVEIDLEGKIQSEINTGLDFFNHMLEQLPKHSGIGLKVKCEGDLHIDEHHTIEDTAITLGEAFHKALGNKLGIERYGFCLPMDDSLATVAIDFGGRNWLVWNAQFNREKIGDMPTEMFYHFFKSFSDGAKCNININVDGDNEHHKIESIFKAFAKAIKMCIKRESGNFILPSTKGVL